MALYADITHEPIQVRRFMICINNRETFQRLAWIFPNKSQKGCEKLLNRVTKLVQ